MKTFEEWWAQQQASKNQFVSAGFVARLAWNAALEATACDRIDPGSESLAFEKMAEGCKLREVFVGAWFCDWTQAGRIRRMVPCEADGCPVWHFIKQLPKPTGLWD